MILVISRSIKITTLLIERYQIHFNFQSIKPFEIWGPKKRVNCLTFLTRQIIARGRWSELPILREIIHSPLLTKTGEVIAEPVYHKGTGYLLTFNPGEFQITSDPYPIWRVIQIAASIPMPDQIKGKVGQGFLVVLFII